MRLIDIFRTIVVNIKGKDIIYKYLISSFRLSYDKNYF